MATHNSDLQESLRLVKPPVRLVRLTVRFDATGLLQASHVASLRGRWRNDYPEVLERVPTPSPASPSLMQMSGDSSAWPIAHTTYLSKDSGQEISFQGDFLEIAWTFSEGEDYPGFDVLANELSHRFGEFQEALYDEAGIQLTFTGSECRYENLMSGISAAELSVGLLTDWAGSPAAELPQNGYVGARIHACADEATHNCSSFIAADGDDDEDATLSIIVGRSVAEDEDEAKLGGLHEAHAELISLFLKYTSETQRQKWGQFT